MGTEREMRRIAPQHEVGDMSSEIQISIIDDDEQSRDALAGLMQAMGFTIEAFASAVDFLASANVRHTSCLIVDVQMPRMTGTELHGRLVGSGYDIPTILITAYPDGSARTRALGQGVVGYLTKPIDEKVLLGCVESALRRAKSNENPS
jgi:FixJ family two-component response regulator